MHRGRLSSSTEYRAIVRKWFHGEWGPIGENIEFDRACDGIFPLITKDVNMNNEGGLSMYKYRSHMEKIHEQLKSVCGVVPIVLC